MTGSKRRVGLRGGRGALVAAAAASAVLAFGASSAQAAVFNPTFDDAGLDLGGVKFDILDPPDTASLNGTIDGAGDFTVPNTGFSFPSFSGDALPGVPVSVDLTAPPGDITGHLDLVTGALTTDPHNYQAVVSSLGGICTYVVSLAFSTAPGSPFNGDPFTVVGTDPVGLDNGVMQSSWGAGAIPGDGSLGCAPAAAVLNTLLSQAGGLALGRNADITPETPATTPAATTVPNKLSKRQRCIKKAKKIKDKQTRKKALKKCKKKKKKKK